MRPSSAAASRWWWPQLAGAFAVFHGYAHTVEMPIGASALDYALGFIAGTIILHGAGLGAGLVLNRVMPVRRTA
ncbi:MAG: hypothetical protein EHM74_08920, partial [Hyphomicrobiales bacterium]